MAEQFVVQPIQLAQELGVVGHQGVARRLRGEQLGSLGRVRSSIVRVAQLRSESLR